MMLNTRITYFPWASKGDSPLRERDKETVKTTIKKEIVIKEANERS